MEAGKPDQAGIEGVLCGGTRGRPRHLHTMALHSWRSEEHTSELQSLMRISYAVFCLKKKNNKITTINDKQGESDSKQENIQVKAKTVDYRKHDRVKDKA